MTTSWNFARLLKTVSEVQQNQYINDNDRIALLREMHAQLPVERPCVQVTNRRAIIDQMIQETLSGYEAPNKTHQRPLRPSAVLHISPPSNTLSVTLYESATIACKLGQPLRCPFFMANWNHNWREL